MPRILRIDFETTSIADLKVVGAYNYARHPSTKVLCLAWAFDDDPIQVWKIGENPSVLDPLLDHVHENGLVGGWNAGNFEVEIWNLVFLDQIRVHPNVLDLYWLYAEQIEDTMIQAAYWGLPLSLDTTSQIIAPDYPKDKDGHRLMMQMAKPRKLNSITGKATWWHEDEPAKLDRLAVYCKQDVAAERAIAKRLLSIPPSVREQWITDQKINRRGVLIDTDTVQHMVKLSGQAQGDANLEISGLTGGEVTATTQTARLLGWARSQGYPHDNLRKDTVQHYLDTNAGPQGLAGMYLDRALALRLDSAKTSVAKLHRMMTGAARADQRVRGMMQFYGAFRTGRWAGRLIQLQNMPRGEFDDNAPIVDALHTRRPYGWIKQNVGPVAKVVSSGLRACLKPAKGHKYVCADLGQIEARVVAWLAGQTDILNVFARGEDVYAYTGAKVTGKPVDQCGKGTSERALGKVLVLACGFGMGAQRFLETAAKSGVKLTAYEAQSAVQTWRAENSMIQQLWWDMDKAMRAVTSGKTDTAHVAQGKITFQALTDMHGRHVLMILPCRKRCLVYRNAELRDNPNRPGETEITFMGLNQYTNKWERLRTYGGMLTENAVQATARDVIAVGIQRCEGDGIPIILTVHDEILAEVPANEAKKVSNQVLSNLTKHDTWYADLPVTADVWVGDYYRK